MVVQIRTDGYLQLSVIEYGQQLQTMSRHVPINLNVSCNFILVFNFVSRFQIMNRQGLFIFYLNTVYHGKKTKKTKEDGNCAALQLDGRTTSRQSFWLFLAIFNVVLRMGTNSYFAASDQTADIANMGGGYDLWYLTLNDCSRPTSGVT